MIVKIINIFIVVHLIKNNDKILITMKENNEIITNEQCDKQQKSLEDTIAKHSRKEDINLTTVLQWLFYILGAILIVMSVVKYNADLETYHDEFHFDEIGYVGGDAYNYIISAARSTAIMIKSLILALFGCTSIIGGLILRISNKK
jgi:hypothetical protein